MVFLIIARIFFSIIVIGYPIFYISAHGRSFSKNFLLICKNKMETLRELGHIQKDRLKKITTKSDQQGKNTAYNQQNPEDENDILDTPTSIVHKQGVDIGIDLTSKVAEQNTAMDDNIISPIQTRKKITTIGKNKKTQVLIDKILQSAMLYKEKGQFDLYEKKLIEGIAIDSNNQIINRKLADRYFHDNNYKKSLTILKKLIDLYPEDHEALWQLGEIYLEQGEFSQSKLLIQKAISLASDRPKYYVSLVEVYYNEGQLDEAIKNMKKTISLRPNNVGYILAIAGLYEDIGDPTNAKKYYFDVLELEPTNAKARRKLHAL